MSTETVATEPPDAGPPPDATRKRFVIPERFFTLQSYVALALVFLLSVIISPRRDGQILFLDTDNLLDVLRQVSEIGIIAVGMTFVILVAGIDLSVGAVLGLASTGVASLLVADGYGLLPAVLLVLFIGLMFGAVQGTLTTFLGIQAFIVTLAGMQVARGLARIWSDGQVIGISYDGGAGSVPSSFELLDSHTFNGTVPIPALIFVAVGVIALLVVRYTVFARHVYAIGGNERAARLSGIPVARVKITVFAVAGLLAALAGIIHAGQYNQGDPNAGIEYELDAIAAVVIGGTSLMGGVGSVAGTLAGALLLGILNNILLLKNIDSDIQLLIKGVIIVAAAGIQVFRTQRR
ncbi:MAG: ABC transporter permease [Nocardioidaceae bacterium]